MGDWAAVRHVWGGRDNPVDTSATVGLRSHRGSPPPLRRPGSAPQVTTLGLPHSVGATQDRVRPSVRILRYVWAGHRGDPARRHDDPLVTGMAGVAMAGWGARRSIRSPIEAPGRIE